MVTGAARAEAAVLIIDAYEGIKENSKRQRDNCRDCGRSY